MAENKIIAHLQARRGRRYHLVAEVEVEEIDGRPPEIIIHEGRGYRFYREASNEIGPEKYIEATTVIVQR